MMRIILGIIAFLLTFGFSVTLIGLVFGFPENAAPTSYEFRTKSSAAQKIESLLKRDVRNGQTRFGTAAQLFRSGNDIESLYTSAKYRSTVVKYVNRSSSMSDAGLPRDFQYAWRKHMNAWKKQAAYVRSVEKSVGASDNASLANGVDNTREINRTWYQVLRIAKRYGVRIDRNYYR